MCALGRGEHATTAWRLRTTSTSTPPGAIRNPSGPRSKRSDTTSPDMSRSTPRECRSGSPPARRTTRLYRSVELVALLAPRVTVIVVSSSLPEAGLVLQEQLYSVQPLG